MSMRSGELTRQLFMVGLSNSFQSLKAFFVMRWSRLKKSILCAMTEREKISTFLCDDTEFEGKLTFHGTIRIDSHFKGEISCDGNLIVGEQGMIEANIHASNIDIIGEIHGSIIADQRIEIHAPGKVFGSIQAPIVVTHEGMIFEGNCRMHQVKGLYERKSAPIS